VNTKELKIKYLVGGVAIGLLLGILFYNIFGNRFEVKTWGPMGIYLVKTDRWTGRSWINQSFGSYKWEEVNNK